MRNIDADFGALKIKNMSNKVENYQKQRADFLDNLLPDDFRNPGSFNQAGIIIDQLNKSLHRALSKEENPQEFIKKAVTHLFRENSLAVEKAISLSNAYLEMRLEK